MSDLNIQNQAPILDVSDVASLLQIVDMASQRGAFRGSELSKIGAIYDKVEAALNAAKALQNNTPVQNI